MKGETFKCISAYFIWNGIEILNDIVCFDLLMFKCHCCMSRDEERRIVCFEYYWVPKLSIASNSWYSNETAICVEQWCDILTCIRAYFIWNVEFINAGLLQTDDCSNAMTYRLEGCISVGIVFCSTA